ncbi:MAG TPA: cytochrome c [Terriglobales bacterium]|nr:cytochrome c [Terriglobales bacterium]
MAKIETVLTRTLLATLATAIILWGTALAAQDAAATYKAKCSACHGADAKGETPVGKKMGIKDLASPEVQKMSDDEMTAIIADGKNKMPSYKKSLKPEQIKELVGYLRSLAKK